jgi:hypothetical protein
MTVDVLEPRIELLGEEYVLVQAWKKTAAHIRYHNWYSDTLELDRTAVKLPQFLAELAEQLRVPDQWDNGVLRIVPAPKSQRWRVTRETGRWEPVEEGKTASKLRPLAHVTLKDQVAATALMLCLADRVETLQGDPRRPVADGESREKVVSYGNRLFCDVVDRALRHRWGSARLYRAYYQDYRTFLARPEIAAEAIIVDDGSRVLIVHSDLRQFYDRVRPSLLAEKLGRIVQPNDDPEFFTLANRLLNWTWSRRDSGEVAAYAAQAGLTDFSRVALPQGLVAAGFFANLVLLDFDQAIRGALSQEIAPGVRLHDFCRYVDDLRIVVTADQATSLVEVERLITDWLQRVLDRHAKGLQPSADKTRAAAFRGDERPLVRQSRKMARIQTGVSGGFDAIGGEEILDAVEGLIRSQQRYSQQRTEDQGWQFSPIPDVRDATVARFAAGRFRSTYRSLRPLLADCEDIPGAAGIADPTDVSVGRSRVPRTRAELDDEARAFALGLIENWIDDPSNVRLLRIGLDLWPAPDVLKNVLGLLRPFTEKGGRRKAPRRVAWYCLAEIFRAGATETGFVEDNESLPTGVDVAAYRSVLWDEAVRLASLPSSTLPWYLRQQALLFLAAAGANREPVTQSGSTAETRYYYELIRFLNGEGDGTGGVDLTSLAILSRRAFRGQATAVQLASKQINTRRFEQIAQCDPSFGIEILASRPDLTVELAPRLRDDLCLGRSTGTDSEGWRSLSETVLDTGPNGPLRNEAGILRFASKFLAAWPAARATEAITPTNVLLKFRAEKGATGELDELKIVASRVAPAGSLYRPPPWCPVDERWRFHLGYLLRFILAARADFTVVIHPTRWKDNAAIYRAPESHWYQRLYGFFNGHSAFGDDWLPISDWTELLLSALLNWPGCRRSALSEWVRAGIGETRARLDVRLAEFPGMKGTPSGILILSLSAPRFVRSPVQRPLRACVVQTVIPTPTDFTPADLTVSGPAIRRRHRNHLSAALAAIERMLDLRETHKGRDGRLDWLILPELSVHPRDIRTHLVPFARAYKTIILAGLTYEEVFPGEPLVNSAIWVIPVWSAAHGLQVLIRRQGKLHLAPDEERLNITGSVVQGFRPCQWLVGYEWSGRREDRPLWLTSSVCYDATDLRLVADLCHRSDVFAIPALNKDVTTFDQMALALHYHMFQMVIVANNGLYGGSNAYVPYRDSFVRQVFHLHGQPQASVAFLEIDDIAAFISRQVDSMKSAAAGTVTGASSLMWKCPPAGL